MKSGEDVYFTYLTTPWHYQESWKHLGRSWTTRRCCPRLRWWGRGGRGGRCRTLPGCTSCCPPGWPAGTGPTHRHISPCWPPAQSTWQLTSQTFLVKLSDCLLYISRNILLIVSLFHILVLIVKLLPLNVLKYLIYLSKLSLDKVSYVTERLWSAAVEVIMDSRLVTGGIMIIMI